MCFRVRARLGRWH
ncbi:hypothetical protein F383_01023 [Gossypium arboreum]|nr:hypothetical protein F383_01023 [Gossypium arboreum]